MMAEILADQMWCDLTCMSRLCQGAAARQGHQLCLPGLLPVRLMTWMDIAQALILSWNLNMHTAPDEALSLSFHSCHEEVTPMLNLRRPREPTGHGDSNPFIDDHQHQRSIHGLHR
jgi:hypothetical protein